MFKNLRQGQSIYILHKEDKENKEDKMYYEVATVVSVDNLRPKVPGMNPYAPQEMVVDIKAKIGKDNLNIPSVPADLVITDYKPSNGEKLVLSSGLAAFNSEIDSIKQRSRQELDRTDYNVSVIDICEKMQIQLNPQFAKDKERDEEMSGMKQELSSLRETNEKLMAMMQTFLEKQSVSTTKKTTAQ